tara:strand:- start:7647 stop:10286 length:2640 start_codon:yes stop_codon:yes gene_type:complete
MANKARFLSGKRKLSTLSGLSTDRHVYLSPEETEPNLGFVGEKTLPIRDEYYQLVTVENGGQYDRYWQVAPSGILTTGLTIFDEGGIVGTGNSISKLDFVGNIVNVTANNFGSISTITISPPGSASQIIFNDDGSFDASPYLLVNSSGIVTATDVFQIGVGGTILSSKTNGNIGIGSAIPKYDLDIVGNVKISGAIVDAGDGTGSTGELLVKTATGGMQWQTANAVTSGAGGTVSQIQYHSASGTVGGADVFWYDYTNNRIGIGTQSPEVIFEVVGNSKFSETTETKNLTVTGVSSFTGVSTFTTGVVVGSAVSSSNLTVDGGSFVSGMSTASVFDGKVTKKAITEQVQTSSADGANDLLLIYDADQDTTRSISIEDATFQGLQGIQGQQGTQGRQGTQAAQGTTGEQGLQGIQGVQGIQGIGASGVQGVQGNQGIQGEQGIQGRQGRQGNQGRQGRQGRQGIQGNQGIQGISGAQGNQASQGIQGIQGVTGAQGTQGLQGRQGYQGIQGVQGIQGNQGLQGVQGTTGAQGDQGIQGIQGIQGVGAQGVQGVQGGEGPQGQQGVQGIQGVQGTQGFQGIQGIQGEQGIQGIQGVQGNTGEEGAQGIQGIQGPQGTQGIQGDNGVGSQGIQGIQGLLGLQGPDGNQGVQGIQGIQGIQGVLGVQGNTGQGNQGIQGITGSQGIQGLQGNQGISGVVGGQGIQGIQGVQGIQGTGAVGGVVTGSIVWYAGDKGSGSYPTPPSGFLYCDGASYGNISNNPGIGQHQDLYNAIGFQYGGSGQNFSVPDLRGEFIRGYDDAKGVDSGRAFASSQSHQFQTHTHDIPIHALGNSDWSGGANDRPAADDSSFIRNVEGGSPNATNGGNNGSETRPRNINFLPIIKT